MHIPKSLGKSKTGFVKGAVILAVAGVICRLLGVVFRIPLSNIIGNYGIGLYQLVFPLYSLLLIISSAGVPVAISKMVARERDNKPKCKKILFNSTVALSAVGLVLAVLFAVFCKPIAGFQGKSEIWTLYLAIAPSVFFVCFISAFRGYFQGLNNMLPTAISQIVEQIVKVGAGLTLAFILVKQSVLLAVFGAILAVSISELTATIFLCIFYFCHNRKQNAKQHTARNNGRNGNQNAPNNTKENAEHNESGEKSTEKNVTDNKKNAKQHAKPKMRCKIDWQIIRQIFITAVPITLMSIVFPSVLMF
ncbi:MAG: oligosaccharide flippase family protein, partial [Christensenellaceae bacterium]|nr:oligosaccharide flippase family protein [Christensenellaceae bacterium]